MRFLTVQEVAERVGMAPVTIYEEIKQGRLAAHRIGRHYRIEESKLHQWLEATKTKQGRG